MIRRIGACLVLVSAATIWSHGHLRIAKGSVEPSFANGGQRRPAQDDRGTETQPAGDTNSERQPASDMVGKNAVTEHVMQADVIFDDHAFPPTIPDTEWHQKAWWESNCLRCHETGVGDAPMVVHEKMPQILLSAKCRSCHVLIPGSAPRKKPEETRRSPFDDNAFPPMIPNSESHNRAWTKDDCLLCHDSGICDAPVVRHEGLPKILMTAKCRSCHVQVRAVESGPPAK